MPTFSPYLSHIAGGARVEGARVEGGARVKICVALCLCLAVLASSCGRTAAQYITRGNQLFASGKYEDAVLNYRNAIKKDPKSGEAFYRLALALFRTNKVPDGYQSLIRAVDLSPDNIPAKIELASLSLAAYAQSPQHPAAFYDRAVKIADQLLASNANSADGLRLKAGVALMDNKPGQAVSFLRRALEASPGNPDIQTALAEALFRDNQPEAGEKEARDAVAHHPEFGRAYDLLYSQYILAKRWDDAEALLKLRISNNPKDASPVMRLAGFYAGRQKPEEAGKLIDSLVARQDTFPDADLLAGDFHSVTRSFDKALADYQRGLSRDKPRQNTYQLRSAAVLAILGRRDEGLKDVNAVLAKDPQDLTGRALKASILLEMRGAQNFKDAGAITAELAKEAPGNARIQLLSGQAALANVEFDTAIARFQQASRIEPRSTVPHLALARTYLLRKNFPAMLEQANAALAINNQDNNARLYRVMALTGTGSFATAETEAEQLAKDTSNARQVEMQLGIIALSQKKYALAQDHFEKLYREGGAQDVSPLAGLVSTLVAENNSDRALALLATQEKRTPDSLPTQALTVAAAQAAGKFDVAMAELQKMSVQNPKSADVQIRIAELQHRQGNLLACIDAYQHARQLDPKRKGILAAIGSAQSELGDSTGAIDSYRKALAETPDNAFVLNNLAYLLVETHGDLTEANRLVSEGLRKAPDNSSLKDTLGWVEVQQGNTSAALPLLSGLARKEPDNVTFLYHYAVALFRSGDHNGAKRELETALAKQPPEPMQKDIRDLLAKAN